MNKIIALLLIGLLIVSVVININMYTQTKGIRADIDTISIEIEEIKGNIKEKTTLAEEQGVSISELETKNSELVSEKDLLDKEIEGLKTKVSELDKEIEIIKPKE